MRSLWEPFDRAAGREDLLLTWEDRGFKSWSWEAWQRQALGCAAGFRARGVRPRDRVAFLLQNSFEACAAVLGAWLAGATVVSFPLIARGMAPREYAAQLRRLVKQSAPAALVADGALLDRLAPHELGVRLVAQQEIASDRAVEPALPEPDQPAFVQYSSGSTTDPKGCVLSSRAIAHQLASLERALEIDAERDTVVAWLPLSHDMGLFGCLLLSYWTGHRLVLGTPERFLTNPGSWLADCARFGATISPTPNFALEMAARAAERTLPPPVPMRRLVIGGERVEPATLRRAVRSLGPERLPPSAVMPAYGLAEAVLAVTMTPIGTGATTLRLDADALAAGAVRPLDSAENDESYELVSAGPPLPGNTVDISPADGVGQVTIRSPSVAEGYLPDDGDSGFGDDGFRTNDLGFLLGGQLYITGRSDDLVSLSGRNVYARDIEASLAAVDGVRPGRCAVVDVGGEANVQLVALVESTLANPDHRAMTKALATSAWAACGVRIHQCVFLPAGRFPKTPSGKMQRFRCREIAQHDRDVVRTTP